MSNNDEEKAIIQWLDGELPEEDLRKILPKEDLLAYKQILEEVDSWTPDNSQEVFDVTEITRTSPQESPTTVAPQEAKVRKLNSWVPMSIAASVILLIVAGIFMLSDFGRTTYVAENGQSKEVNLPDGISTVTLAAGAEISWADEDWTDAGRTMQIKGKAFFDVGKGSPFIVEAENGKVEVLGTQFEVSGFEKTFIVACYEGKVRATATDEQEVILNAGEESVYFGDRWESKRSTEGAVPPWFDSKMVFENAPLDQVLAKLEKTYSVKFVAEEIDLQQKFSGKVPTNNLKASLKLVLPPYQINYKTVGKTIYLSK